MPRWPDDTRDRLVAAALELFGERGFAAVTIDEIAARAGVSARTFFRHFGDKEEVLFAADDELLPALLAAIAGPPGPQRADVLMAHALGTLAGVMEPTRAMLRIRQGIVDGEVALTGRALAKQARWQHEVAGALRERGFDDEHAEVLSAVGFALFRSALHAWLAEGEGEGEGESLAAHVARALPVARSALEQVSAR